MNGKKFLAALVCAIMLITCSGIGALAADISPEAVAYVRPSVTSIVCNQVGKNYVYVDIETENSANDQPVIVYMMDGSELLTLAYEPVSGNKATVKLGVPDSVETGEYTVVAALNKAADVEKAKFSYIGVGDVDGFFQAVNATEGEVEEIKALLEEHYVALSVIECERDADGKVILKLTGDDYEALSDDSEDTIGGKTAFAELILNGVNGKYTALKGTFVAENAEAFVKEAYIIAAYNNGGFTYEKLAKLVYNYDSVIGFDGEDENLYGKIQNKDTFVQIAKTMAGTVSNADELEEVLEKAVCVQIVNETHWLNLVQVVADNNDLFQVDEEEIERLLESKSLRTKFCEEFKGTYYSVNGIREAWDLAYKEATKKSGGGGGVVSDSDNDKDKDKDKETTVVINTVSTQISNTENNYDPNVEILDYYNDMGTYAWASDDILNLTKAGIVSGYGDGTFRPEGTITRAEFMKMIVNVFALADITATSTFTDVDPSAWYYIYVASAEKAGIAQGYGNGLFGVNDNITRQDAITIIYRAAQYKGISLEKFYSGAGNLKDKNEIAAYAYPAVEALYNAGVYLDATDPKSLNTFEPTRNASRAYVSVILNRVYMYMTK